MGQQFVQISDPHLTTLESATFTQLLNKRLLGYLSWRRQRRAEHRPEVLQALQRDLQRWQLDQLLITGDLPNGGTPEVRMRKVTPWRRRRWKLSRPTSRT